jgi:hypothetical protein
MSLPSWSLRAATIVILALTIFGVLMSVYPIEGFNTQRAEEPIIPVWDPSDEKPTAEQTEDDDTPTLTLSSAPTQSETSGATETAIDPWTSEVVEAALREPQSQGSNKADEAASKRYDLPGVAFDNPAARPADPVLPKVESPSSENTITSSQDPALTSTAQYPDVTAQPLPPQSSPPDSPVDTEMVPQPLLDLPADTDTSWQLPPESSADTEAFPQPLAPPDEPTPSR